MGKPIGPVFTVRNFQDELRRGVRCHCIEHKDLAKRRLLAFHSPNQHSRVSPATDHCEGGGGVTQINFIARIRGNEGNL